MIREKGTMLNINLPQRTKKIREAGLSNLVDKGYGLGQLEDILSFCADYVDIVKLGWGSAYITKNLKEKVKLFNKFTIRVCPGGMFFELCYWQGKIGEYIEFLRGLNIDMVEVSNGSLPITEKEKVEMIRQFKNEGFCVLSEVGSKDVNIMVPPDVWVKCINDDIEAGAWKVICEGRADASAGIYTHDGIVKDDIIEAIMTSDIDINKILFETPHKEHMVYFISKIGCNVNLGNIPLENIMDLETLRLGLRGDTVNIFHSKRKYH